MIKKERKIKNKSKEIDFKYSKRTYYLAHPFGSRKRILKWQKELEKQFLNISFVNPFLINVYEDGKCGVKKLVETDISLIRQTDGTIAIVDGMPSIGTLMKIAYAYKFKKPIYTIAETEYAQKHPWIIYHSTKIFPTILDLINFFKLRAEGRINI